MRVVTRFFAGMLAATLLLPVSAWAEALTFHLSVADVFASVNRTNAFLASLGKPVRGVKLVPGGTLYGGQTCASLDDLYRVGAVTVLDGPAALGDLVSSRRGKDAAALAAAFGRAGIVNWVPPATVAETTLQLWSASAVPHGLRFLADGFAVGTEDGLLKTSDGTSVLRFRGDLPAAPIPDAPYRLLLELIGRAPVDNGKGVVTLVERRCFTFVDVESVDLSELARLVNATVESGQVRQALQSRLDWIATALAHRDIGLALDTLAVFMGHLIGRTPELVPPDISRRVVAAASRVRREIEFHPATAVCGNGVRETGEACDGADFGGFDCAGAGFASGTLGCLPDCRLDTTGCVANPVCGNGVLEIGEQCDNGAANSDTAPDACRTSCKRAFCGDGVIDVFEDCEGRNLDGETCASIGYDRGTLRCDEYCEFDDTRCADEEF